MDRKQGSRAGRARLLFGAFCCVALLALGSGQWAAEPVDALQVRSTVPSRTPTPQPGDSQPAPVVSTTPTVTPTATITPTISPAQVLPHVGAMHGEQALPGVPRLP
ncbi:MAG: hypothetical protein GX657_17830 [Chloroflexi bacterium]|jgi:hypothetical protein|nr:hypothetical protein [Chloroflexota bacterium]